MQGRGGVDGGGGGGERSLISQAEGFLQRSTL